jgi:hypothetical protein
MAAVDSVGKSVLPIRRNCDTNQHPHCAKSLHGLLRPLASTSVPPDTELRWLTQRLMRSHETCRPVMRAQRMSAKCIPRAACGTSHGVGSGGPFCAAVQIAMLPQQPRLIDRCPVAASWSLASYFHSDNHPRHFSVLAIYRTLGRSNRQLSGPSAARRVIISIVDPFAGVILCNSQTRAKSLCAFC